jgi:hypothetical protein
LGENPADSLLGFASPKHEWISDKKSLKKWNSSKENSRPAGFVDAFGRKIVLRYASVEEQRKTKKMLEEKEKETRGEISKKTKKKYDSYENQ